VTDHPTPRSAQPAPAEYELLTSEAYARYRNALGEAQRRDLDLYEKLSQRPGIMRQLYLAYLDLDTTGLPDHNDTADRADALEEGLLFRTAGRIRITYDGLHMLWQWKTAIEPHLRKPMFQTLFRQVCGW
jgi:hypothetical protein